jgi:hypothetical protein
MHRIIITLPTNILQITMPRWKQFLTACLLVFSSMLFSCDALIDNIVKGEALPKTIETKIGVILRPIDVKAGTALAAKDSLINCSVSTADTVVREEIVQGDISIAPEPPIEDIAIDFVGHVVIDRNVISPITPVDAATIKNPPKADSTNCNNMKYY